MLSEGLRRKASPSGLAESEAKHLALVKNNRIIPAAGASELLRSALAGRWGERIGQFESTINGR